MAYLDFDGSGEQEILATAYTVVLYEQEFKRDIIKDVFGRIDLRKAGANVDENGNVVMKKGKPVPDTDLRDTENVPLTEDIDAYFAREVLPYAPDAWIDRSKTKVGYEIPMTRYFYEYQAPESVDSIMERITALEQDISEGLKALFHKEG